MVKIGPEWEREGKKRTENDREREMREEEREREMREEERERWGGRGERHPLLSQAKRTFPHNLCVSLNIFFRHSSLLERPQCVNGVL